MKSYSRSAFLTLLVVLVTLASTLQVQSAAIKLTPGNILVSFAWFPNDSTPYEGKIFLHEYTPAGDYVQEIATPFNNVDSAVGNITDSLGRVHIYYRDVYSRRDYLSTLELDTGIWQTHYVGYPTQGLFEFDLATHGKYVFQRDTRINLETFEVEKFDTGLLLGSTETNVGLDKKLYAVRGATPQSEIQKLDPDTLQKIGPKLTARDEFGNRIHIAGIAAAENGDIFASQRLGWVYHYNSQMQLLNYRDFDISGFDASSLKINSSGMIVMGGRNGEIVVTDTSLQTKLFFRSARRETYASFIVPRIPAIPEPYGLQLILVALGGSSLLRRRRLMFSPGSRQSAVKLAAEK